MTGILQSALTGGRALLIGWFLPSLINVLIFGFVVAPKLSGFALLSGSADTEPARAAIFALAGTTIAGLTLAALQTPLYRLLEGYLGWPEQAFRAGQRRQLARKHLLANRIEAATLAARESADALSDAGQVTLAAFRAHPVTGPFIGSDVRKGMLGLSLLDEQLHRFPADDQQVTPTKLGNAIRRFEEYGYDRFRLDSQVLWHELYAAAPESARRQADDARTNVDFFICLLYGHLLVAFAALVALVVANPARPWLLAVIMIGLPVLAVVWYHVAVAATDDWAGAVRAMVNLSRQPLANGIGLRLPSSIGAERAMWDLTVQLARGPFGRKMEALDAFREAPPQAQPDCAADLAASDQAAPEASADQAPPAQS